MKTFRSFFDPPPPMTLEMRICRVCKGAACICCQWRGVVDVMVPLPPWIGGNVIVMPDKEKP